jgi:glycosyltransferase involved in cell wall biosynthesis
MNAEVDATGTPRKPRVLVLTHSLSEVDGVGVYGVSTLRFLAPRCAGIEVYTGRRHRGFASDMPHEGITVHPVLPMNHFPFLSLPKLALLLVTSLPMLVRAARRADIVHSFSDYPMGFVAVLTGVLSGRPVVVSGHGTYSVTPAAMPIHQNLLNWMYRRADRFLMGARFALRQVERVVDPGDAEVVPYGCVPDDYDRFAARGETPDVPGPYVLCVGEVKQRKGYSTSLPAFLAAWRRHPAAHYAIVGRYADGDPYYLALRAQIEEAGATDHVHFIGNVDEAQKVALMRGAQVFMLTPQTSKEGGFEAFGLVFLESGAAGRPVVGVLDSGAEDAITDGENGFLRDREDIDGLADALVQLFGSEALADRMGAAGRLRAEGQTWESAATRVAEVYAEVLAKRARETAGARAR